MEQLMLIIPMVMIGAQVITMFIYEITDTMQTHKDFVL